MGKNIFKSGRIHLSNISKGIFLEYHKMLHCTAVDYRQMIEPDIKLATFATSTSHSAQKVGFGFDRSSRPMLEIWMLINLSNWSSTAIRTNILQVFSALPLKW